jgi:ATP-binding protein involved in chromosome partitioning
MGSQVLIPVADDDHHRAEVTPPLACERMSMAKDTNCKTCNSQTCSAKQPRQGESPEDFLERQALAERLCRIRHKLLVLSGKGGVGKSTVALSLAARRVGLLDVDIHGPSVPKLLGLDDIRIELDDGAMVPVEVGALKVMSIGFLLSGPDQAVIWRGPMKMGVIKQFLKDVAWGDLEDLVIDCPPGTGDEPLSVAQLIEKADGAVIVTTPQEVALLDVRKSIGFCRQLRLPILGVIENMSGFVCPHCGTTTDLFKAGGGERMAVEMGVPFLGCVPIDPAVVESGDTGRPCVYHCANSPGASAFARIAEALRDRLEKEQTHAS